MKSTQFLNISDKRSLPEIMEYFEDGCLGNLAHAELRYHLGTKEQKLVAEEQAELIRKNAELGGSPKGFYFKGELYGQIASISDGAITEIDPSLHTEAKNLRENRMDISQYTTYLAHFLGFLDTNEEDAFAYAANVISGLEQFSPSLKLFMTHHYNADPDHVESLKYDREDPQRAVYFSHYDRIADPLKRFLFRKITQ